MDQKGWAALEAAARISTPGICPHLCRFDRGCQLVKLLGGSSIVLPGFWEELPGCRLDRRIACPLLDSCSRCLSPICCVLAYCALTLVGVYCCLQAFPSSCSVGHAPQGLVQLVHKRGFGDRQGAHQ